MSSTPILSKFPAKKGKFSATEVKIFVKGLLENGPINREYEIDKTSHNVNLVKEDTIFEKIAFALEGRRTAKQVEQYYYNIKKILEDEQRFVVVIDNNTNIEEKMELKNILLGLNNRKRKAESDEDDYGDWENLYEGTPKHEIKKMCNVKSPTSEMASSLASLDLKHQPFKQNN